MFYSMADILLEHRYDVLLVNIESFLLCSYELSMNRNGNLPIHYVMKKHIYNFNAS